MSETTSLDAPADRLIFDPPVLAVLFDLDETLCRTSVYFLWRILALGIQSLRQGPMAPIRLLRLLRTFRQVRESFRGTVCVPGLRHVQFELTAQRLGVPVEEVDGVVRPLIYENRYEGLAAYCEPSLPSTLRSLKDSGYKLGVLSDYPTQAKLAGMGLGEFGWDVLLSGDEVEALKPQPTLFQRALTTLKIEPNQALYVGDRPDTDVEGARALGMRSCLVRRWGRTAPQADLVVSRLSELVRLL